MTNDTPMKAIRLKCLDCSCGNPNEVTLCPITGCPLYSYRSGKTGRKRTPMTEEQRAASAEYLAEARRIKAQGV